MSRRGAPSWTCPWCERVVPARETRCHCGCDRAVADAKEAAASSGTDDTGRRGLLVVALLAVCGLVAYAGFSLRAPGNSAALTESQRLPPTAPPTAPPSGPPPTYGDLRTGGGFTPPVYVSAPPPSVEPSPVVVAPSPKPSEAASPALSTMEEEWEKASELLEPRLEKIAKDSNALESSYYPFAGQCLPPGAGGSGAGSWLFALKSAPLIEGVLFVDGNIDCASARGRLVARADQIKSELNAAEEVGRVSRVLPGHWRKLLALHQLAAWDQY